MGMMTFPYETLSRRSCSDMEVKQFNKSTDVAVLVIYALTLFVLLIKKVRNFSHSAGDYTVAVVRGGLTRLLMVLNKVKGLS